MSEIVFRAWRLMEPVWETSDYPDGSPFGKTWDSLRTAQERLVAAWRPQALRVAYRPWDTIKCQDTPYCEPDRRSWRTVGSAGGREIQLWSWQYYTPLEWERVAKPAGRLVQMPAGAGWMVNTYWYAEELSVWRES